MLDENEVSGKDQFLGDSDWLSKMQYTEVRYLRTIRTGPFLRFRRACAVRS